MFVFDESTFDIFIEDVQSSKIIGINITEIFQDLYIFVATKNQHYLVSFSEEESYLDEINYLQVILDELGKDNYTLFCCFKSYLTKLTNRIRLLNNYFNYNNINNLNILDLKYIIYIYKNILNNKDELDIEELENKNYISENEFYNDNKQFFQKIFNDKKLLTILLKKGIKSYHKLHLSKCILFNSIEKNGINVVSKGSTFFTNCLKKGEQKVLYPSYNIYTNNGRVYSSTLEFNCCAIPTKLPRSEIHSKFDNGILFYFDYISLHPRICLYLIRDFLKIKEINEFDIENEDIYNHIKDIYKLEFSRDEIKNITWKTIYGHQKEYKYISVFKYINILSKYIYKKYLQRGYILNRYERQFYLNDINNSEGKVFANYLQSMESDFTIQRLKLVDKFTENKNSHSVLQMFDGILFDYNPKDDIKIIRKVKKLLEYGSKEDKVFGLKKFPLSVYAGKDFQNLRKI